MIIKLLLKEEEADGVRYKYFYKLLKKDHIIDSENTGKLFIESYGIEIERHDLISGSLVNIEQDCMYNITSNESKAHNILMYLYENTVSPVHIADVIRHEREKVL